MKSHDEIVGGILDWGEKLPHPSLRKRVDHMRMLATGLDLYRKQGVPTGGFLKKLLENDLMGAMSKADHISMTLFPELCSYIYNHMPHDCWGGPQQVKDWLSKTADEFIELNKIWKEHKKRND